MLSHPKLNRLCENAMLLLLALTVLWKGGKTLESTWLLAGVASVCALVQHLAKNQEVRSKNQDARMQWVVLLFILWTTVSYVFSKTQNYGLDEVLRDGALGLLLLWYLNRRDDNQDQLKSQISNLKSQTFEERCMTWLAHLTIASCIIGIVIYIFQPVNRFVGTFVDPRFHTDYWPNAFAEFLLLTWPVVLLQRSSTWRMEPFDGAQGKNGKWKMLFHYFLPLGLVFGSLFLSYSRGALIAFLVQVVLLFALLFMGRKVGGEIWKPLTLLTSALVLGGLLFGGINGARSLFHPVQLIEEKLTFSAPEGTSSISERREFWRQATLLALQKPLFGWGPGSFRFVQPRLQEQVLATSDHPHNVFLKLAMERGIPASLLFALIAAYALLGGVRISLTGKRLHPGDHTRLQAPLLTVSLAGALAHNLIDVNLQFVGIALPFWMVMGMLLRSERSKNASAELSTGQESRIKNVSRRINSPANASTNDAVFTYRSPHSYFLSLHSLLALIFLLIALREGIYLVTSSLGRHAETRGDAVTALQWYDASEQEWFTRDLHLSEATLALGEGDLERAEDAVRRFLERNVEDARAWKLQGTILEARDDFPGAIGAYERAFALGSWNDLSISRGLLETLFAETYRAETGDAAAESKQLPLHPHIASIAPEIEERVERFAEAIEHNLHFVALSPNPEEASRILITLAVLHPAKDDHYQTLREKIEEATKRERAKTRARKPGWLW